MALYNLSQALALIVLPSLITTFLLLPARTEAIDGKCAACYSVGSELAAVLAAERPRNHLDMRNRLNSKGVREGKVIDYKISELRTVELLEGLCRRMKFYLYNTTAKDWVKVQNEGARTSGWGHALAEARSKEITNYCSMLIEDVEEQLTAAIRGGHFEEVEPSFELCHIITKHCDEKPARSKSKEEGEAKRETEGGDEVPVASSKEEL